MADGKSTAVGAGWIVAGVLALAGAGYFLWRHFRGTGETGGKPASLGSSVAAQGGANAIAGVENPGQVAEVTTIMAGVDNQAAQSAILQSQALSTGNQPTVAPPEVLAGSPATIAPATIDPFVDESVTREPLESLAAPASLVRPLDAQHAPDSVAGTSIINVLFS